MKNRLPLLRTYALIAGVGALFLLFVPMDRESVDQPGPGNIPSSLPVTNGEVSTASAGSNPDLISRLGGDPMLTGELAGESHFRRIEIVQIPGIPHPIRREQVYHVVQNGQRILKSQDAYSAGQVILGINGNRIPPEMEEFGTYTPLYPNTGLGHYLLRLPNPNTDSVSHALAMLRDQRFSNLVRFAEPDWLVHAAVLPNDPSVQDGSQWAVRDQPSGSDIHAEAGWDIRTDASDVVVAVLDTGILETHEDLAANLWNNPDEIPGNDLDDDNNGVVDDVFGFNAISNRGNISDDNGHGSHVAGIIGAAGNNGLGTAGVSWSVQLMAIKSLNEQGSGLASDIAEGLLYAVDQGAQIINTSLGSPSFQTAISEAITYAEENNVIIVAAAGNDGNNNDISPRYPASFDLPNIVAVASLDQSGDLSSFSNYGKRSVDFAAPGGGILSPHHTSNTAYATLDGTSMAAPHVSGVLALLIQEFPSEDYRRYIDRLYQGGSILGSVSGIVTYSSGLDMAKSLSIQDPPAGLRFTSQMPNPLVRFQLQDLQLETRVEDDTNTDYVWFKDGNSIAGSANALVLENLRLNDAGIYSVMVEKGGQQIYDVSRLTVIAASVGLSAALESSLTVGSESEHPWVATSEASTLGSTSLFSAPIGHDSSSSLYSHVTGEGRLSFDWKVSSELGYDFLQFLVNGEVVKSLTGDTSWRDFDIKLQGPELKILQWRYLKDGSVSEGLDRGYLDHLAWNPTTAGLPYITSQPEGLILSVGEDASLSVVAEGEDLKYQWFKDGLEIAGSILPGLDLLDVSSGDSGVYHVEVYNEIGSVLSQPVGVKVGDFPVEILSHPTDRTVLEGLPVQLSVNAFGSPPLHYQWYKDGAVLSGETEREFALNAPAPSDSGSYHVVVSNAFSPDGVRSDSASLIVQELQVGPSIIKQSFNLSVPEGQPAELYVTATGTGPLNYQWYFNDEAIESATQSSYRVDRVSPENTGTYYCVVSNLVGEAQSVLMFISLRGNVGNALEQPLLSWELNNELNIRQDLNTSHDGEDSLALFAEPDSNSTWISTQVEGPVEVTFWYSMDGMETPESGRLYLSLNGELLEELDNPDEFAFRSFLIEEPGVHELRWTHVSNTHPLHAFLDQLTVTPITLIRNPASQITLPTGENFSIDLDFLSREPYLLEWLKDGQLMPSQNFPLLSLSNLTESDSGIYQARITNDVHEIYSNEFELTVASVSIGDALETPDLNFDFPTGGLWLPQSEEKVNGHSALEAPFGRLSRMRTFVKGPISGQFYSKNLEFSATLPFGFEESEQQNGWVLTTLHFPHPKYYELVWTSRGETEAFLDSLDLFPQFYISRNPNDWELSDASELAKLQVEVVGKGDIQYQWYRDEVAIPSATEDVFWVSFSDVETEQSYHVEVSRNHVVLKSRTVTVSRRELPDDTSAFEHEGFSFSTQGEGWWKVSNLEPTASGGLSLSPGIVVNKDYYNYLSRLSFTVPGPGELSFRVKLNDPNGELNLEDWNSDDNEDYYFYYNKEWIHFTHRIRSPYTHTLRFEYSTFPPYNYDEVPVYVDDLKFSPAPVSDRKLDNLFTTPGASLIRRAFPVTEESYEISWYKNGQRLSEWSGANEIRIDDLQEADEGMYAVQMRESGGATSLEEFEVDLTEPLEEILDSNVEHWRVSSPGDWKIEELENANGNKVLVSSLERYSDREILQDLRDPEVWLEPVVGGPGTLTIRYKFSADVDDSRIQIVLDEHRERYSSYEYSEDWIEEKVVINEADFERLRLVFKVDPGFIDNRRNLILDSVHFEPEIFLERIPQPQIANVGDRFDYQVKSVVLNGATTTYDWIKAGNLIYTSNDGRLVIPSLSEEHFGEFTLKIKSSLGAEREYRFQIIDASIINRGMKQNTISFRGTAHGTVALELREESNRENTLYLTGDDEFYWLEFETQLEGPFVLRFDTKRDLTGDASIECKFFVNGEKVQSLYNDEWSTYEYVETREGLFNLRWFVEVGSANLPAGWYFDNLEILRDPLIVRQPTGVSLLSGSPFILSAAVIQGKNGAVQWYQNGKKVEGANRNFLPVINSGYSGNGEYQLLVENDYGSVESEPVEVVFQDSLPSEFPPQTWNRKLLYRERISYSIDGGVNGGPAIVFNPSLDHVLNPAVNFTLLGPRTIEFLATVPDSKANSFGYVPESVSSAPWQALSRNWVRQQIRLETLEPFDVTLAFSSQIPVGDDEFDSSAGKIDKLQASWIEGHPFTKWLKQHYPSNYQTITDLELLFGDDDEDGVFNFLEFATMSSPTLPGSNVWIERNLTSPVEVWVPGHLGWRKVTLYDNEVSLLFFKPLMPDSPGFSYALEYSPDLKNWTTIPADTDQGYILEDWQLVRMWPVNGSYDDSSTAFFRLAVSAEMYDMLNLE